MGKLSGSLASVTRVGLDLAKNVFYVHCVDGEGNVVLARKLRRGSVIEFFQRLPACVVAMEACSTSHHWGRQIAALGHEVRLIPPAHVKPYVRRNKTDAVDAGAICEAALRPGQRFVPLRSVENQAAVMCHRVREQFVEQRTALINALRSHMSEVGVIAPQGAQHAYQLILLIENGFDDNGEVVVCESVRAALAPLVKQIEAIDKQVAAIDAELAAAAKADEKAKQLMTVPGVGPVIATAILATVGDISSFVSGREFAAFLGLTPRQHSSGGKERSGRISKMGDRYLRKLLVVGATSALGHAAGHNDALRRWAKNLLARKAGSAKYAFKLTAVALANKLARIVFAILRSGKPYDDRPVAA
jgi:transposase